MKRARDYTDEAHFLRAKADERKASQDAEFNRIENAAAYASANRLSKYPVTCPETAARLKAEPRYSSLDEPENTVETPRVDTPSQLVVFHGLTDQRKLAMAAMSKAEPNEHVRSAFASCASGAVVERSPSTGQTRLVMFTCRNKLCPRCARVRRSIYASKLEKAIGEAKPNQWRFITLTLRGADEPLAKQLDHLAASFRRLRQQTLWKRSVTRAKAVVELTWNEAREQWHPHLHILAEGRYIPQHSLSLCWEKASDGSSIVDIRPLEDTGKAVRYICKYLGKTPDLSKASNPIDRLAEFYSATKARKLIMHVGHWPQDLDDDKEPEPQDDPGDWVKVGSLDDIYARAVAGDLEAQGIINAIVKSDRASWGIFDGDG